MRVLVWTIAALLVTAPARGGTRDVQAVNIGWHVGLAFAVGDLDAAAFPEIADFPDARWIEVGWGDARFYRDPDAGIAAMLQAAFASTEAVLHVVAMPAHPALYLPAAEVVTIPLDNARFDRLVAFVSGTVDRGGRGRADAIAPGLYPVSRFYPAIGQFSLARTCNTWVAEGLATAGVPLDPDGVVRAGVLMSRLAVALGGAAATPTAASDPR